MDYETHIVLRKVKHIVGGSLSEYVKKKLKYTDNQICNALSAEQVDAVALAIYNIEYKHAGMIIGDQTGIGKGRVAASIIRYGCLQGLQPIFLSEKPNLFSDIYRDLTAIGSSDLVPFIVNGKESKTDIKDENGNIVYQAPPAPEQNRIFLDQKVPKKYDYVCCTYSQFNSAEKKPVKPNFILSIAQNNILVMDEAHNASGSSNTGNFMQSVLKSCKGVTFLSATFSKRPDNMPVYAMKTSMSEANMTTEEMVEAIKSGGVALQEILSAQLVSEGQMLRREYSFDGIEVNYINLDEKEQEHRAISDNITQVLRDIISFQEDFVTKLVDGMDKIEAAKGGQSDIREGTSKAGVDNSPYFSKVFQVINQMLFAIKAESVADRAIMRLKENKKPVIAFASTMGAFLESMENEQGLPLQPGDVVSADYKTVLFRGLEGVMKYTVTGVDGQKEYKTFNVTELSQEAQAEYFRIRNNIQKISTGISISPIDLIIRKLESAGYSVAEVTGRKYELQLNDNFSTGMFQNRKKLNTNDAFRMFNNNEVDVLMINQSGSTGASAHAIVTDKVPAEKVRPRVMIILQAELNINTEVQKRGRINRTGQILKPVYDYVISAIPAEKRLMMMLQKKLKSLDANTTSNQKQSSKVLQVDDFLNKYGDKIVLEYLLENPDLNKILGDPLKMETAGESKSEDNSPVENGAAKVSGRVAVLNTEMQAKFYSEIMERYIGYVEYLKSVDEYDLEVESMPLEAETLEESVIIAGKGGDSVFAQNTILEKCEVNILKKPFTRAELENLVNESLDGRNAVEIQSELRTNFREYMDQKKKENNQKTKEQYQKHIRNITSEKAYQKIPEESQALRDIYYREREKALLTAMEEELSMQEQKAENQFRHIDGIFRFFKIGRGLNYPTVSYEQGAKYSKAVFLGYIIDSKKDNPFAPSAIRARFAIADSTKYLPLVLSGDQGNKVMAIIGASYELSSNEVADMVENWESFTKESNKSRGNRYIITGNLLQGAGKFNGKLISYTTKDGSTKKGMIMSEKWEPKSKGGQEQKVTIPIIKCLSLFKNMYDGDNLSTANNISIYKNWYGYKIVMPKSKAYKPMFTDPDIMQLLENKRDGFEMVSNQMVGKINVENIDSLVKIFQDKFSLSMEVDKSQADELVKVISNKFEKDIATKRAEKDFEIDKKHFEARKSPQAAKSNDQTIELRIRIAKAKAKGLLLKLKLTEYKQVAGIY